MILLIGFYQDVTPARTREFIECLEHNVENPHLGHIVVFVEDLLSAAQLRACHTVFTASKLRLVEYGRRLRFSDLFDYANRNCRGDAVILANSDIYFDDSLALLDDEPLSEMLLCLSRWDRTAQGLVHFDRPDSQDAWIFEPPVPYIDCDFYLGLPGCDNRLAYEAERAGLAISNPSRSVRACHLHSTEIRRHTARDRLVGPLRFAPASYLPARCLTGAPKKGQGGERFPSHRGCLVEKLRLERRRALESVLEPHLPGGISRGLRRELSRAAALQVPELERPSGVAFAEIAFRERMGYTLARLELGASTHNNSSRPLVSIPPELAGLCFTQVVANHAASVEIEFRSSGRLLVLASPGWEGYRPAAEYLDDAGWREPLPPLRAHEGTTFEVWSLLAQQGERLVVPTQVMLSSEHLLRIPD